MNPNKALWEKGDFTQIAATMRQSGEELIETLDITGRMDVLDLAAATERQHFHRRRVAQMFLGSTRHRP